MTLMSLHSSRSVDRYFMEMRRAASRSATLCGRSGGDASTASRRHTNSTRASGSRFTNASAC